MKGAVSPQCEVERLIEKGNVKEAFKQAKLCFREAETAENRRLVERTYLLRIQSLVRGGMVEAGREVAGNLLDFGVTNQDLLQQLVLELPRLGMADKALALQGQLPSPAADSGLTVILADRAVLHPEELPASMTELREAAGQVRLALETLDSGEEARALELLQSIPRSSPLADWRLFIRGLAAFRREDIEQAKANWDRLDQQRSAWTIARTLLSTIGPDAADNRTDQLRRLEVPLFGEPVLERLSHLSAALEAGDWKRALQLVGPLRRTLQRVEPRWSQRLTEIVLSPLASELMQRDFRSAKQTIRDFTAALEPLPWDPKWNRFQALLWEGAQGSPDQAIRYWRDYVQDLEQCFPAETDELRQRQALVWRRIGDLYAELAGGSVDEDQLPPIHDKKNDLESDDWGNEDRSNAIAAVRQSLSLDPSQRKTHALLIEFHEMWRHAEEYRAAVAGLLEVFPQDEEALQRLIDYHLRRDEPEPMLRYLQRLVALKPLDSNLVNFEVWARGALARHRALKGRWDEGRAEFARLQELPGGLVPAGWLLSRRAAFEFKAKQDAAAEEFIRQAQTRPDEHTSLWLSLAIEAARYKLPRPLQQRFNEQFKESLAQKVTSQTAGALAAIMFAHSDVEYTGRATHLKLICSYLRRTTRLKFQEDDLEYVCMLLKPIDRELPLLDKLASRGLKQFPKSPFFLHLHVVCDLKMPDRYPDPARLRKQLEKALELAQASQKPREFFLIREIRKTLSEIPEMQAAMPQFPFPFGEPPGGKESVLEMMKRMVAGIEIDDLFISDDDDDEVFDEDPVDDRAGSRSKRKKR